MADRIFILGLGAQKAGTTWLYHYLAGCEGTAFGGIKEHHVWDVRQDPALFRRFAVDEGVLFRKRRTERLPALRLRYALQRVDGAYGGHFRHLVEAEGARITGDLTPSHAALSAATLARIRTELEANGFAVRPVFLMRDPVERIWSAVRMERRIALGNGADPAALPDEATQVAEAFRTPDVALRTRYDRTIAAAEAVFPREAIHYAIHEELFTPQALGALCDFLGLPCHPERLSRRLNVTERGAPLPEPLRAAIRAEYDPVYRFCAERFPQTRVLWGEPGLDKRPEFR